MSDNDDSNDNRSSAKEREDALSVINSGGIRHLNFDRCPLRNVTMSQPVLDGLLRLVKKEFMAEFTGAIEKACDKAYLDDGWARYLIDGEQAKLDAIDTWDALSDHLHQVGDLGVQLVMMAQRRLSVGEWIESLPSANASARG